jgi:hypothetical protein
LLYDLGAAVNYSVCLVLYIFTVVAMWNIRIRAVTGPRSEGTAFQRIADGIMYIRRRPILFGAISLDLFAMFLGGTTALLPVFAREILNVGPVGLGLLRTAPALGATIVAVVLTRRQLHRHTGMWMFACVAAFGAATIVFGLSRDFYVSLLALTLTGAGDMVSVYVRSAMVQLATPDHMRGRVGSLNSLFVGASNELGEFRAGMTAGAFGTVPAVVLGGFGTLTGQGNGQGGREQGQKADQLPGYRKIDDPAVMVQLVTAPRDMGFWSTPVIVPAKVKVSAPPKKSGRRGPTPTKGKRVSS